MQCISQSNEVADERSRALVVDDDPAVRLQVVRALSEQGFRCDAVQNGVEALEMIFANQYDVVITDLRMPQLQGSALATSLLSADQRPAIVVLTGVTVQSLADDLISRGVEDVLFKPIDYNILAAKVRAIADRRASQALCKSSAEVTVQ
jgi:DNA-binding response OmpR family regulator